MASEILRSATNKGYSVTGLIKSYLSSRKQITKFDDVMSDAENIIFGVPQGSVLGPFFS